LQVHWLPSAGPMNHHTGGERSPSPKRDKSEDKNGDKDAPARVPPACARREL